MTGKISEPGPESDNGRRTIARCGDYTLRRLGILLVIALATVTWGADYASAQAEAAAEKAEALAADDEAAAPTEEERTGIEELVVTGKRGVEFLQEVPESISSFSEADILDRGITNFETLQYNVPSLFTGGGLSKTTLRGVGSEIVGPGIDPGFAVHVDSVFSARESTGLIPYFDIERVDILRGPQGMFWGRNSTGGAINLITKKPVFEIEASADVEYGRFDGGPHGSLDDGANGVLTRGMFNLPLVEDQLAARIALLGIFNDGQMLMESENNRQRVSDNKLGTVRASLRWQPHDDVTVDFIGSWFRMKDAGSGQKFDGDYFTPPVGPLGPTWPGAGPGSDYEGIDSSLGVALPNPDDPYRGTANEPQYQESTVWTATLLVGWEADQFRLDSITGFQSTDYFLHRDQDTSSLPISTLDLTDESRQISQEFLINATWDLPVDYTLGAIYQYDWTPITQLYLPNQQNTLEVVNWRLVPSFPDDDFDPYPNLSLVDGCPLKPTPGLFGAWPSGCPPVKPFLQPRDDFINALTEVENHVFGLYGNVSWEVIDDLTVGVGGRFSYTYRDWDDQSLSQTYSVFPPLQGIQVTQRGLHQTHDWKAGTWKVTVDYQLLDDHLLWASVGTGSRAGGFNFSEERPFDDESILAVEAGVKSMFFDNRLMLNLTGFWYDWDDPQIAGRENALPITKNAPSAVSYGVELELMALPIDDLAINGSFGWLEAFYDEDYFERDVTQPDYTETDISVRDRLVNLNGNRMPRSPRFTGSLGAQYTFDIGRCGSLVPRVDFYYRDEVTFRQYDNPKDVARWYTRTDARITWRSEDGHYWVEIFARNIENKAVKTNQEILDNIYRVHYYAPPMSGGLRIGYSF